MSVNFMPGHFDGLSFSRPSFSAPPLKDRAVNSLLISGRELSGDAGGIRTATYGLGLMNPEIAGVGGRQVSKY